MVHCQGDPSPTCDEIYLPMLLRKVDMYDAMVHDFKNDEFIDNKYIPSEIYFNKIWRKEFKHVKFLKDTRLGFCDTCTKLQAEKQHANPVRRRILMR